MIFMCVLQKITAVDKNKTLHHHHVMFMHPQASTNEHLTVLLLIIVNFTCQKYLQHSTCIATVAFHKLRFH